MSWGIDKTGKDRAKLKRAVNRLLDGAKRHTPEPPGPEAIEGVKIAVSQAIDALGHYNGPLQVQTTGHLYATGGSLEIKITALEPLADDDPD